MNIRPGDLVMVIAPEACGCLDAQMGGPRLVIEVAPASDDPSCTICYRPLPDGPVACLKGHEDFYVSMNRLIKIDPPALPESIETDEAIHA